MAWFPGMVWAPADRSSRRKRRVHVGLWIGHEASKLAVRVGLRIEPLSGLAGGLLTRGTYGVYSPVPEARRAGVVGGAFLAAERLTLTDGLVTTIYTGCVRQGQRMQRARTA